MGSLINIGKVAPFFLYTIPFFCLCLTTAVTAVRTACQDWEPKTLGPMEPLLPSSGNLSLVNMWLLSQRVLHLPNLEAAAGKALRPPMLPTFLLTPMTPTRAICKGCHRPVHWAG